MSLVEELSISLKDLFPLRGIMVANGKGMDLVIVSLRLHERLMSYAAKNRVPLTTRALPIAGGNSRAPDVTAEYQGQQMLKTVLLLALCDPV